MADTTVAASLAATLLVCTACGSAAPTSPTPGMTLIVAPGTIQAGRWKGTFEITSCSTTLFSCNRSPTPFVLQLTDFGAGVLLMSADGRTTIDVSASQAAGMTIVAGSYTASRRSVDVELRLTQMSETLQGTAHYRISDGFSTTVDARILFAARDPTVYPGQFHGEWIGHAAPSSCTGDCNSRDPLLFDSEPLQLSQAGTAITGMFARVPLKGTVDGLSMTASAYNLSTTNCYIDYDFGVTACVKDMTMTAALDKLNRLHGSFTYKVEGRSESGRPNAFTATATLTDFVRWP